MSYNISELFVPSLAGLISLYVLWSYFVSSPKSSTPTPKVPTLNGNFKPGNQSADLPEAGRDFVKRMELQKKKVVVFYGSQTGTAEDYATRLAKEAKSRYGISSLVADPDDYDFDTLDQMTEDQLAVFVMATYGEGEPTDNAVNMLEFLKTTPKDQLDLSKLKFVVFALGNRTYEQFCAMGKIIDEELTGKGARRIGELGMGDDDKSMEEDYLAWKDPMWLAVQAEMGWEEGAGGDVADFDVKEIDPKEADESRVYKGELSARALLGTPGVFNAKNPYIAPVSETKELFIAGDRNCVHVEFDLKGSGLRYQPGDHLAVWPVNPDSEVERLMKLLGLWKKRETVVDLTSLDPTLAKVPFPSPAAYDAIFRHYLDISTTASRQLLSSLAQFAPTERAREEMRELGTNKDRYSNTVARLGLRLGECMMMAMNGPLESEDPLSENFGAGWLEEWKIPFDRIVSGLPRLQPRFYSISSSPKMVPDKVHITAVVLKYGSGDRLVYGCGTNYLLNVKLALNGEHERLANQPIDQRHHGVPKYKLEGPRGKYLGPSGELRIPIHIRRSSMRLPTSPHIPVVMIGPGTGVAPFRSFIQERVTSARKAKERGGGLEQWANIVLFYGCRKENEDFLYREEWDQYAAELDGKFKMFTAVSRKPGTEKKRYVQDDIWDQRSMIGEMILQKKGYTYICGDAKHMAKDVEETLRKVLGEYRGGTAEVEGAQELKILKDRNRLLLDVWS
ncbi:uncharacterized protein MELLADRAFT_77606 [Melampsora larici-populina 98AG31]|uniref:NADPH--cytochrome P450 reductase n=1 Tax=Melampsora larici-populina (strain 98AG31 / pathotype 3-4-7) TaxID=747676 RepID=F4RJP2_MELLP|nr:uncharacterized protein MELLADRAFT_77606 [Melampsora larici-populina 98AG31]EGG07344.1 hypothetical protein MELLADRAFT_77606 [Melampsora larici-populina 98AG31]